MRPFLRLFLLLGLLAPAALPAGTITGVVRARGATPPAAADGGGDAYASRRYKFVERLDYRKLTDFVVHLEGPVPGPPPAEAAVVQRDAAFEPHVLPVVVGTVVRWPNADDIYHNVFSMSEQQPFDLGLYTSRDKPPAITFDKVGRVDVFCSIHPRMHCIILVLPNAHFAKVDAGGRYRLRDVPAGTWRVRAWHERLPARTLEVTVPAEGEVSLDFELGLGELPKP